MNSDIKRILLKLERNGYEAYIVGGYVRDYLLGVKSVDIDLCTNALPKDVFRIFKIKKGISKYGSVSFKYGKYNLDITTYRMESNYNNHRPKTVEYIDNLLLDIERRDFTINSICMNKDGKLFDYVSGINDLNNKIINVIGSVDRLKEDPLRILRAIRFAICLDFKLSEDIVSFINENKELIKEISFDRRKIELEKIFISKNVIKGLELLKELDLLDILEIKYDRITYVSDVIGLWAQLDFSDNYVFSRSVLDMIKKIRTILNDKIINEITLLNYDLYICIVAGEILGYSKKDINRIYHKMPINKLKDLKITNMEIMNLLGIEGSPVVKKIYNDVLEKVITGKLKNNKR